MLHFRDMKDFRLLNRKTLIATIYHGFLSVSTEIRRFSFFCKERDFMYEKFEKLLEKNNTTPYRVSKATGIATATLSDWKNGKSNPKKDKLALIANYFKVPVSFFDDIPSPNCLECGELLNPYGEAVNFHDIQHEKWQKAVDKFGFCWPHSVCENAKGLARAKLDKGKNILSLDERIILTEEIFKSLFSRSLTANDFSLLHPTYEQYVSMLLNQKQFEKKVDDEVRQALIKKYGTTPGIKEGETYYHVPRIKKVSPAPSRLSYEDTKKLLARNGNEFTTEQRLELIKLLSEIK